MKNLVKIQTIIAVSVLFLFSGCTKQSDPTPSMSATINGMLFNAIGNRVGSQGSPGALTTVTASNLPVAGSSVPTTISITVLNAKDTYVFNSSSGNSNVTIYYSSAATGGLPVAATSGQVKVTNSSAHYIQGTFSFNYLTTTDSYVITNGQFTGKY